MKTKGIFYLLVVLLLTGCSAVSNPGTVNENQAENSAGLSNSVSTVPPVSNERNPVEQLLPLSGARLNNPIVLLTWQVVPGAASYNVEISADPAFEQLHSRYEVSLPPKYTNPLPQGVYFWRVQAAALDGSVTAFSPPAQFQVLPAETSAPIGRTHLDVPYLYQAKDSAMLLLESDQETGSHAWNRPHGNFDPGDPAGSANSALACTAMLNRFYGGDLTQDRIGYKIFKDRLPGPEGDLPYGVGPDQEETAAALVFALQEEPVEWPGMAAGSKQQDFPEWAVRQIDNGSPVIASANNHTVLITGYEIAGTSTIWWIHDPAAGVYCLEDGLNAWSWAYAVENPQPAFLEEALLADSDQDGVLDFDENERFRTDPNDPDSDGDGIMDGDEIRMSVFDRQFGYGLANNPQGRDQDMDGLPMELDSDSDNGGCLDGFEDSNLDGIYRPEYGETSNFDPEDDRCYALNISWDADDDWGVTSVEWRGSFKIDPLNKVQGTGTAVLAHTGTCVDSTLTTFFTLRGSVGEELVLQLVLPEQYKVGTFSADELHEDCSIGMAIEENWMISNEMTAGMPLEITLPSDMLNNQEPQTLTPPADAYRSAAIHLKIQAINMD